MRSKARVIATSGRGLGFGLVSCFIMRRCVATKSDVVVTYEREGEVLRCGGGGTFAFLVPPPPNVSVYSTWRWIISVPKRHF